MSYKLPKGQVLIMDNSTKPSPIVCVAYRPVITKQTGFHCMVHGQDTFVVKKDSPDVCHMCGYIFEWTNNSNNFIHKGYHVIEGENNYVGRALMDAAPGNKITCIYRKSYEESYSNKNI